MDNEFERSITKLKYTLTKTQFYWGLVATERVSKGHYSPVSSFWEIM